MKPFIHKSVLSRIQVFFPVILEEGERSGDNIVTILLTHRRRRLTLRPVIGVLLLPFLPNETSWLQGFCKQAYLLLVNLKFKRVLTF